MDQPRLTMESPMFGRYLFVVAVAGSALIASGVSRTRPEAMPGRAGSPPAAMSQLAVRNLDIAFYAKRAGEDAWSAADRAALATLYLQRARETGDYEDFRRAEQSARAALALRSSRNTKAQLALASS